MARRCPNNSLITYLVVSACQPSSSNFGDLVRRAWRSPSRACKYERGDRWSCTTEGRPSLRIVTADRLPAGGGAHHHCRASAIHGLVKRPRRPLIPAPCVEDDLQWARLELRVFEQRPHDRNRRIGHVGWQRRRCVLCVGRVLLRLEVAATLLLLRRLRPELVEPTAQRWEPRVRAGPTPR